MADYVGDELELFREAHNWKSYLRSRLSPHVRGEVLEVGAGIGGTTRVLRALEHARWTCLEPDREHVRRLREAFCPTDGPTLEVVHGDIRALADERRFDTILYVDVLEHVADDRAELAAAARHLRAGGAILVLAPAHPWLFSPFDAAVGHFRRYTRPSLRALGSDRLSCERADYLDSAGLLASAANRLLLRSALPSRAQIRFWDGVLVPLSRIADRCFGYRLGKSVLGVFRCSGQEGA